MRTTLKRGMGRAATLNGNGRAVLPPQVLEPMRRDLQVPIYCNGSNYALKTDRINSAWATCHEQGTLDTVEHLTGIPVNYLITVDFHGFKLLVNKVKGVYVDVDHRYLNTTGGPGGYATINLQPGYQKLDGQQALDFV